MTEEKPKPEDDDETSRIDISPTGGLKASGPNVDILFRAVFWASMILSAGAAFGMAFKSIAEMFRSNQ